jgi:hypothetical protein
MSRQAYTGWLLLSPPFPESGEARLVFREHADLLSGTAVGNDGDIAGLQRTLNRSLERAHAVERPAALRAVLCVLTDLARQGWLIRVTDEGAVEVKRQGPFQDVDLGRVGEDFDDSETWVDPIVGTRFAVDLAERWAITGEADVGGVVAGSDLSWNVQGYLGYRTSVFGQPTNFAIGYRALYVDYDHNEFKWDVTQHGPILGAVLRF